jgi:hypothetical protein
MLEDEMTLPVVRVSILRCDAAAFDMFRRMMIEAEAVLAPGIGAMRGCRAYYVGVDQASLSLSNVSIWDTIDDARQMERYQPMLDLGRQFSEAGARFERPIMNYSTLWQIEPAKPAI